MIIHFLHQTKEEGLLSPNTNNMKERLMEFRRVVAGRSSGSALKGTSGLDQFANIVQSINIKLQGKQVFIKIKTVPLSFPNTIRALTPVVAIKHVPSWCAIASTPNLKYIPKTKDQENVLADNMLCA